MIDCPLCGTKNPQWLGTHTMSRLFQPPVTEAHIRKLCREGKIDGAEKNEAGEWRAPTQPYLNYVSRRNGTA